MTDEEAMDLWLQTGCVTQDYMDRVCGVGGGVTIGPRPFYAEEELARMPSPFGPEPVEPAKP